MPKKVKAAKKPAKKPAGKLLKPLRLPRREKPEFRRSESWRYVRVKERWRAARGLDSKMRLRRRSQPKLPSIGYGASRKSRGLHPSRLREVLVYNPEDLQKIDSKRQAVRVAHTVGAKKRIEIFEKARKRKLLILNPRGIKPIEPKKSASLGS